MKKILFILLSLVSLVSYAQVDDTQLTTLATQIETETTAGANTKTRVAYLFKQIINSKPNLLSTYSNPTWISSIAYSKLTGVPTTVAGLGITDPFVFTSGSYSNPAWITALAWSKVSGTPTTISGYGITDPIVLTSGSYANPAWITSLAWSKISSTPTTVSGYGITDAATLTGSQTLTNKTLTSPIINLGSDATGDLYYRNSGGLFTRLGIGSNTNVLTVSGGLPTWQAASAGSSTFVGLTDGPGAFTGKSLNFARVNVGETALEYQTPSQVRTDIGAQASGSYAVTTNNLSDLSSASTARTNLGLGTLATQNGTSPAGTIVGNTDSQTLTNKTISGASNTLSNIPESAVTNLVTDLAGLVSQTFTSNTQNASYAPVLADNYKTVIMNSASTTTVTINQSIFPVDATQITIVRYGVGAVNIVAGTGVTIRSAGGALGLRSQYSSAMIIGIKNTNEFLLIGDIQ